MTRNCATPAGAALGRELARVIDKAEPRARLASPTIPPRCASYAFRGGPHVANGSEVTFRNALSCSVDGAESGCHEPARAVQPCSGWLMLQLANPEHSCAASWEFRDEAKTGRVKS